MKIHIPQLAFKFISFCHYFMLLFRDRLRLKLYNVADRIWYSDVSGP